MMNTIILHPIQLQLCQPGAIYTVYDARPSISPVRVDPHWRYESPSTKSRPAVKPLPILLALQGAGIHPAEGSWLLYQLAKEGDRPYHAALLMNGKSCVISQNDRVFYGQPGKLEPQKVVHSWRTKCLNEQSRYIKTENGLEITLHVKGGLKSVRINRQISGPLRLPLFPKAEARIPQFTERLRGQTIQA